MRGEKRMQWISRDKYLGSPPHARGKGCRPARSAGAAGITPACAGKRALQRLDIVRLWDHPRMRGEKFCCTW